MYTYKTQILSKVSTVRIENERLLFSKGSDVESFSFAEISELRMRSIGSEYCCIIITKCGKKKKITYNEASNVFFKKIDTGRSYSDLVKCIHGQLENNFQVKFYQSSTFFHVLGFVVILISFLFFWGGVVTLSNKYYRVDALQWIATLSPVFMLFVIGLQMALQGKTKSYDPENIPINLLPSH